MAWHGVNLGRGGYKTLHSILEVAHEICKTAVEPPGMDVFENATPIKNRIEVSNTATKGSRAFGRCPTRLSSDYNVATRLSEVPRCSGIVDHDTVFAGKNDDEIVVNPKRSSRSNIKVATRIGVLNAPGERSFMVKSVRSVYENGVPPTSDVV